MSPEQARGKPLDKRTDVWAFGCVLFEMLSGKRAFEGETVSDTLAAVLMKDPDWSALPSADTGEDQRDPEKVPEARPARPPSRHRRRAPRPRGARRVRKHVRPIRPSKKDQRSQAPLLQAQNGRNASEGGGNISFSRGRLRPHSRPPPGRSRYALAPRNGRQPLPFTRSFRSRRARAFPAGRLPCSRSPATGGSSRSSRRRTPAPSSSTSSTSTVTKCSSCRAAKRRKGPCSRRTRSGSSSRSTSRLARWEPGGSERPASSGNSRFRRA